jgi:hypothetical protein
LTISRPDTPETLEPGKSPLNDPTAGGVRFFFYFLSPRANMRNQAVFANFQPRSFKVVPFIQAEIVRGVPEPLGFINCKHLFKRYPNKPAVMDIRPHDNCS